MLIKIDQTNPDQDLIERAAEAIKAGDIVVFPTDTVYGLGVSLFDTDAIERVFALKGRQGAKGLIVMIADTSEVNGLCSTIPGTAKILMERFWPGSLTLVLPAAQAIPPMITIDGTVGVRLPDSPLVRSLIRAVGGPLATTSANLSGRPSATDAAGAKAAVDGGARIIIDGGPCSLGIESTVVDTQTWPPTVFREGAVSRRDLWEALGIE